MLENIGTYSWATFAVVLLSALLTWFSSRSKKHREKVKLLDEAKANYQKALEEGTPEQIILARRRLEKAKKALIIIAFALPCLYATGCLSATETYIPVGSYIQTPVEGDVVPALPKGENRWLLLSVPTGTSLALEKN